MALRPAVNYVAVFAAVACIAIPWYAVSQKLRDASPVRPSVSSATAVVWGDRVFSSPSGLRLWLRARGASYAVWGGRHPRALSLLRSR